MQGALEIIGDLLHLWPRLLRIICNYIRFAENPQ
jgi:hypothetical protein